MKRILLKDDTQWLHARKSYDKLTGRTEDHVPQICLSQGDLPAVHSRYTHSSSALPEGPLGGLPSLSLTIKGSWMPWGWSRSLSSAIRRQYPPPKKKPLITIAIKNNGWRGIAYRGQRYLLCRKNQRKPSQTARQNLPHCNMCHQSEYKCYRVGFTLAQKNFGNSKVSDFHCLLLLIKQNVLSLEISV